MNQKDLIAALRNEQRQPVDLNLGQVPVSPTIGRMGNYTVVVPGYSRRNAASELSTALSQLPQIAGQFRNIQEKAGVAEANALTTEEVIKRFDDGDVEAKGFLSQFGKDKAFAEQLYQRTFNTVIKKAFIKAAGEIDNMTAEEVSNIGNEEQFKAMAQNKLVSAITEGHPELLETIKKNPYQAVMHNKAMEGAVPSFVEEANAKAVSRKNAFVIKQAEENIATNILSGMDGEIPDYPNDPKLSDAVNAAAKEDFDVQTKNLYTQNAHEVVKNAFEHAVKNGVDKIKAEKIAYSTLSSKLANLHQNENMPALYAMLDAFEDGSIKINNRSFKHTKQGLDIMSVTEKTLNDYEDELKSGELTEDQQELLTSDHFNRIINPIDKIIGAESSVSEIEDLEASLRTDRAALDTRSDLTNDMRLDLSAKYTEGLTRLEAFKQGVDDVSPVYLQTQTARQLVRKFGFNAVSFKQSYVTPSVEALVNRAADANVSDEFQSLMFQNQTINGDLETGFSNQVSYISEAAYDDALTKTVSQDIVTIAKKGGIFAPGMTEDDKAKYNMGMRQMFQEHYNESFKREIQNLSQIQGYVKPPPADAELRNEELLQTLKSPDSVGLGSLSKDGKITYPLIKIQDKAGAASERTVDTDDAFKTVTNSSIRKVFKNKNTLEERQAFFLNAGETKYGRKKARSERGGIIAQSSNPLARKINEFQQSDLWGLPMDILRNNGVDSGEYTTGRTLFGFGPEEYENYTIDYNRNGRLESKEAPSNLIFNLPALLKAVDENDYSDLIGVAVLFGHVPTGATKSNAKVISFFNKQVGVAQKYGALDDNKTKETE